MLGKKLPQSMYVVGPRYKPNEVFKFHNNSRKKEENKKYNSDQVELKTNDEPNDTIKKYNMLIRQPPFHLQRKVSFFIKSITFRQTYVKTVVF